MAGIVSTINLAKGDTTSLGVVASVERNFDNLGAALVRFEDGSHFHAGAFDVWPITPAASA